MIRSQTKKPVVTSSSVGQCTKTSHVRSVGQPIKPVTIKR
jgi:hypothetical protein